MTAFFDRPIVIEYFTRDYYSGFINDWGKCGPVDGEFARNPPHFAGHYFTNFLFNQPIRDYYWQVYLRPGKIWLGKNMAKLSKTRHFIPVIIILSKVIGRPLLIAKNYDF